jgi:homocysteine S-methyltransferase
MTVDDLKERLAGGNTVILDGALGTELQRRGVDTRLPLWSAWALLEAPDVVRAIHREYIDAGADIVVTNTFRTQRRTLAKAGMGERSRELTRLAVELARSARADAAREPLIAGSIAPLEDCYHPERVPGSRELKSEHREMAEDLAGAGVDLLLVETMGTLEEIAAASQAAKSTGLPFMVSGIPREDGHLLGGQPLAEMARMFIPDKPLALLVNCASERMVRRGVDELLRTAEALGAGYLPVGGYANMGTPEDEKGWSFTHELSPATYADHVQDWVRGGARLVGGCCGTTPDHIRELARAFS